MLRFTFVTTVIFSWAFTAALLSSCDKQAPPQGTNATQKDNSQPTTEAPNAHGVARYIVVDQFGYLPDAKKVALIRSPEVGFDAEQSFRPSRIIELVRADTNTVVLQGPAISWNQGGTHLSSGDKVWRFDFSQITTHGTYYVRDTQQHVQSFPFSISPTVYNDVLKHAARTFFYQRAGFTKQPPFADSNWADSASHLGPGQDTQARLYSEPNNPATERDLHGGWYDAGDYNKYTSWTANYVVDLLHTYQERPAAWGDDFNLPESGNGVPDILDEVRWGLDFLLRMQNKNGSVLSIVGLDHASPPSNATGPSFYGPENTSATLATAAAFALGAKVFSQFSATHNQHDEWATYAEQLSLQAELAWRWASHNPNVVFRNNDKAQGSEGLGAGQQEVNDHERLLMKISAATYLFDLTGKAFYKTFFETHYKQTELIRHNFASAFRSRSHRTLLYYAHLNAASEPVTKHIQDTYVKAMKQRNGWSAITNDLDPYGAYIADYTWGSSSIKAAKGNMFYEHILYSLGQQEVHTVRNAAQAYLHYLHGANPLAKTYLSNMAQFGAENSVSEFYHAWFQHGSAQWDSTHFSTHGPAPGFVVGGPNPYYNWDSCCPNQCGSAHNNSACGTSPLSPPRGQPAQKSYVDFNHSWPLNSWEVTENANGYQTQYLRLLSKFVATPTDEP